MMVSAKVCALAVALLGCAVAQPANNEFWKGTSMNGMVEEMRSGCSDGSDPIACIKYKVMSLLDTIFQNDSFKVSESVEVVRNGANDVTGRSQSGDFFDTIEGYIQTHDVTFNLPLADSKITVSPRNLDNEELNLNIKFAGSQEQGKSGGDVEARKSKIKKILFPIVIFVLLKAMTLIPLALGVLGLKAWNALQLSFFSFVVSIALAIFQFCKKITADSSHPQIAAHGPWDAAYASTHRHKRSTEESVPNSSHNMAYNSYL